MNQSGGSPVATADDVLAFWFGTLDADGLADRAMSQRWWKKDAGFDQQIRERFSGTYNAVAAGLCEAWLASPSGRLAYIIVLDQLSRNMFRDDAKMYQADASAQRVAMEGIENGDHEKLAWAERAFFYMPLMHAEDLDSQDTCLALFERLVEQAPPNVASRMEGNIKACHAHRAIIERFGRFPHRNRILSRTSTPQEEVFLTQPGSSF